MDRLLMASSDDEVVVEGGGSTLTVVAAEEGSLEGCAMVESETLALALRVRRSRFRSSTCARTASRS